MDGVRDVLRDVLRGVLRPVRRILRAVEVLVEGRVCVIDDLGDLVDAVRQYALNIRLALLYDLLGFVAESLRLRDEVFQVVEVVFRNVIEVDDLFPVGGVDRAVLVIRNGGVVIHD